MTTLMDRIKEALPGSTEGPWVFDQENVGKSSEWCWQIRTEFGGTPVYVECSSRWARDDHGNDATARLIALAPEMARALEAAEALADMVERASKHGLIPKPVMDELATYRAATEDKA